jgi:hypothetical protein
MVERGGALDDSAVQAAATAVLITLRRGEGLNDKQALNLLHALRPAASAWSDSEVAPRTAANLFVDLANGIDACGHAYGGEEGGRIAAFALEVQEAVREVVRLK